MELLYSVPSGIITLPNCHCPLFIRILTRYDADDNIWKAMIIMAWDGGEPSSVFGASVFKKVLSVFITAAIMKLGQGWSMSVFNTLVCLLE